MKKYGPFAEQAARDRRASGQQADSIVDWMAGLHRLYQITLGDTAEYGLRHNSHNPPPYNSTTTLYGRSGPDLDSQRYWQARLGYRLRG